jgi:hypothetical protein
MTALARSPEIVEAQPGAHILEVWHGGIPRHATPLRRCPLGNDCPTRLGEHSHTHRISDRPFGADWPLWVMGMTERPTLIVHVVNGLASPR